MAPLALSFLAGVVLTPLVRLAALRLGNIDAPIGPKIHKRATPLMGGVAVYLAFLIAASALLPLSRPMAGVLLGGLVAVLVGVWDEMATLKPGTHLVGQVVAALVAIVAGVGTINFVSIPSGGLAAPGWHLWLPIALPITVLWLVGMMNTINFLDGMDGLATGVVALAALLLAAWASLPHAYLADSHHYEHMVLALALGGALLGFLPFNWHVARVFLGDSGSMFLGLALGAISIIGPAKLGTALLVLLIPVGDVAWAIVRRRLSGRSFLAGDKQHVYHRMLQLGMNHTTIVLTLYVLCIALAGLDLLLIKMVKLIAFVLLALAIGATFVLLELRASATQFLSDPSMPTTVHKPSHSDDNDNSVDPAGQHIG